MVCFYEKKKKKKKSLRVCHFEHIIAHVLISAASFISSRVQITLISADALGRSDQICSENDSGPL